MTEYFVFLWGCIGLTLALVGLSVCINAGTGEASEVGCGHPVTDWSHLGKPLKQLCSLKPP
jgi:hypothetical protein